MIFFTKKLAQGEKASYICSRFEREAKRKEEASKSGVKMWIKKMGKSCSEFKSSVPLSSAPKRGVLVRNLKE
jgi:hypothetical protein